MRPLTLAVALALALATAVPGCGGSDDDGSGSGGERASGAERCVEEWNGRAPGDQRAKASLQHRGEGTEPDVVVGPFAGTDFTASGDTFDETGSPTSVEVSVRRGDCVAVDLTGAGDSETNWVMVLARPEGGAPAWYFLDQTGDHPLAKVPQPLESPARVRITGIGREARLLTGGG